MPAAQVRRQHRPIRYRDSQDRVWSVSEAEVARLRGVSPSIDGPNEKPDPTRRLTPNGIDGWGGIRTLVTLVT